jgi:hypothetical protein
MPRSDDSRRAAIHCFAGGGHAEHDDYAGVVDHAEQLDHLVPLTHIVLAVERDAEPPPAEV